MKILYVATVRSHIGQFHMPVIRALKAAGHEVHGAYKDNSADKKGLDLSILDKVFEIPFERSPFKKQNIAAYRELKKVIEAENYDIIHCHTPMGAVITRLAAKNARKRGTKVIYTAHGFHFYKGAPKKNWLMFYPVEKLLAKRTDTLITINQEDYDLAVRRHFKAGRIVKVSGVGVNLSKFTISTPAQQKALREEYGLAQDRFIMLYAADLSVRKNQSMILRALARLKEELPNVLVLMPGQPILREEYERQCAELGICDMVQFMGYRRDIDKLLALCDCVISSSRQEGLPINLIEAAASGKYIISTDVRGSADVVRQSGYGVLVPLNDDAAMADAIRKACREGVPTRQKVDEVKIYDENSIVKTILGIYDETMKRG